LLSARVSFIGVDLDLMDLLTIPVVEIKFVLGKHEAVDSVFADIHLLELEATELGIIKDLIRCSRISLLRYSALHEVMVPLGEDPQVTVLEADLLEGRLGQ